MIWRSTRSIWGEACSMNSLIVRSAYCVAGDIGVSTPSKMRLLMAFRSHFVYSTCRGPIYRALCQFMLVRYTHTYESGKRDQIVHIKYNMLLRKEARTKKNVFRFSL